MSEIWIIMIIVNIFDILILGGIGLLIIKSKKIYIEEEGRWVTGFNLPRLYAEPGDVVDHEGYRKYVGMSMIYFLIIFSLFMNLFVYMLDNEIVSVPITVGIFLLGTFSSVFYLTYRMYAGSEKFIVRNVSKRIRYDKYIVRMIIGILILNSVPFLFTEDPRWIIVSIVGTLYIVIYYMIKIYKILKKNKKDFL